MLSETVSQYNDREQWRQQYLGVSLAVIILLQGINCGAVGCCMERKKEMKEERKRDSK